MAHTRVKECPSDSCTGVFMGYGPMGSTRDFVCLRCGTEGVYRAGEGTYIEFETSIPFTERDGPTRPDDMDDTMSFEEFKTQYGV